MYSPTAHKKKPVRAVAITTTSGSSGRTVTTKVVMTRTGPNDARCVVWAIGKFFFFRVLLILTTILRYSYFYER